MPKQMDLIAELARLEKQDPDTRRQYILRLETQAAKRFINDCLGKGKQPGPLLEEIITAYYAADYRGIQVELTSMDRTLLGLIGASRGCAPEEVAKSLIHANIPAAYQAELDADAKIKNLLAESERRLNPPDKPTE